MDLARQALRQFYLPQANTEDPKEYPHEQLIFAPGSVTVCTSTGIETLFDRVLHETYYGISQAGSTSGITPNNLYAGKFNLVVSNQLN
jgi:hypothetical protein